MAIKDFITDEGNHYFFKIKREDYDKYLKVKHLIPFFTFIEEEIDNIGATELRKKSAKAVSYFKSNKRYKKSFASKEFEEFIWIVTYRILENKYVRSLPNKKSQFVIDCYKIIISDLMSFPKLKFSHYHITVICGYMALLFEIEKSKTSRLKKEFNNGEDPILDDLWQFVKSPLERFNKKSG